MVRRSRRVIKKLLALYENDEVSGMIKNLEDSKVQSKLKFKETHLLMDTIISN